MEYFIAVGPKDKTEWWKWVIIVQVINCDSEEDAIDIAKSKYKDDTRFDGPVRAYIVSAELIIKDYTLDASIAREDCALDTTNG